LTKRLGGWRRRSDPGSRRYPSRRDSRAIITTMTIAAAMPKLIRRWVCGARSRQQQRVTDTRCALGLDERNPAAGKRDLCRKVQQVHGGQDQQHGAYDGRGQNHRRHPRDHGKAHHVGAEEQPADIARTGPVAESRSDTRRRQHAGTGRDDEKKERNRKFEHRRHSPRLPFPDAGRYGALPGQTTPRGITRKTASFSPETGTERD